MRRGVYSMLGIVLISLLAVISTFVFNKKPGLGLDLAGGVSIVLDPYKDGKPTENVTKDQQDQVIKILRNRVDALGVAEPEISTQGKSVLVQIPGIDDQERALELVGRTAELQFRPVTKQSAAAKTDQKAIDKLRAALKVPDGVTAQQIYEQEVPPTTAAPTTTVPVDLTPTAPTTAAASTTAAPTTAASGTEQGAAAPVTDAQSFGRFAAQSAQQDGSTTTAAPTTAASTTGTTATTKAGETTTTAKGATTTAKGVTTTTAHVVKNQWKVDVNKPEYAQLLQLEQAAALNKSVTKADGMQADKVTLLSSDGTRVYELGPIAAKGNILAGASAGLDSQGKWAVFPDFKSGANGIDKFNALAQSCYNAEPTCPALSGSTGQAAIILDGEVLTAPTINDQDKQNGQAFQPYSAGKSGLQISGAFKEQEARDVATALKYGALPLELRASSAQKVSATLGEGALKAALIAGLVGLIAVVAYMLFYYRLLGVSTLGGLLVSGGILWSLICWLGASMTLSGMVGIIVSIGVSLDSNVVFFENLKEDVRKGRTLRSAVEGSFSSAFSTMVKADLSSLIGAGVLYLLTAGPVRGFALYLFITTVIDLVVSYFWMRPTITWMARSKLGLKPSLFGIPTKDLDAPPASSKGAASAEPASTAAAENLIAATTSAVTGSSGSERPSGDVEKGDPR